MRPITKITILGIRLGVIALIVYWIAIFVGTHLPVVPDVGPRVSDKTKHFCAYFGLALILCYVSKPGPRWKRFGGIAVLGVCYAAFDEYTQGFVPRRQPDWMDFLADALGVVTAIALYAFAQIVFQYVWKSRLASRATS